MVAQSVFSHKELQGLNGKEMQFSEIIRAIQDYLEKSDDEIKASISRFYTEINTDGSFIPLGNNVWALRSWYAIDEIDEEFEDGFNEITEENERRVWCGNLRTIFNLDIFSFPRRRRIILNDF